MFFVAALLSKAKEFKDLVKITVIAALYVLVLVVEKDLGGALLYFVIYLMMLMLQPQKQVTYLAVWQQDLWLLLSQIRSLLMYRSV